MVSVVLKPGSSLQPAELLDHCQTRIAHFAVPRYVRFMDELPKNHAERVEKFKLRESGVTDDTWDREEHGYEVRR
jgi:crotonobetaine/carnitine-CoA ligase